MSVSQVSVVGKFAPDRFVQALTDFGPDRARLWGNSSPGHLVVHDRGPSWADVTEGTAAGGIWQRYRYDWSVPGVVRLTVSDSNAFGRGSFWEYRLSPVGLERTQIDLTISRAPTTIKGKLFDPLLSLIGHWYFRRDLRRTVSRIEAEPPRGEDQKPLGGSDG